MASFLHLFSEPVESSAQGPQSGTETETAVARENTDRDAALSSTGTETFTKADRGDRDTDISLTGHRAIPRLEACS